jgi:hypothetical protein
MPGSRQPADREPVVGDIIEPRADDPAARGRAKQKGCNWQPFCSSTPYSEYGGSNQSSLIF